MVIQWIEGSSESFRKYISINHHNSYYCAYNGKTLKKEEEEEEEEKEDKLQNLSLPL